MPTDTSATGPPTDRDDDAVREPAVEEPRAAEPEPGAAEPHSEQVTDPVLTDIGAALFHLRRIWARPDLMKRIRAQTPGGTGGRPLQISNLMVVNAVAALTEAAESSGGTKSAHSADSARSSGSARSSDSADGSACEVTVGAVAERLEIDPSTASRLVGHAIDAGLLSRRPSPVDARRANLGLTEAGRRVKQVADRFRRAYLDELMTGWSADERAEFARLLTRFADAAVRAPRYSDGIDEIFKEAGAAD
ncbi:MarR family winged helix-turn-helix transcriptional regulator [Actinomadura sp. 9N215]|uniref:MarR family winged helix-turn-helix transcriptional regulator n=1 Tax=Actinomadura sp. 9N215 TaxID=3375150 RepID=UPI0037913A7A